jgi:hypothetical protein
MLSKNLFIENFKKHTLFNQGAHKRENKTPKIMSKMELHITNPSTYTFNKSQHEYMYK